MTGWAYSLNLTTTRKNPVVKNIITRRLKAKQVTSDKMPSERGPVVSVNQYRVHVCEGSSRLVCLGYQRA